MFNHKLFIIFRFLNHNALKMKKCYFLILYLDQFSKNGHFKMSNSENFAKR